jgi:hypothetical protein
MRTKKEIERELRRSESIFPSTQTEGFINALKWVLEVTK